MSKKEYWAINMIILLLLVVSTCFAFYSEHVYSKGKELENCRQTILTEMKQVPEIVYQADKVGTLTEIITRYNDCIVNYEK